MYSVFSIPSVGFFPECHLMLTRVRPKSPFVPVGKRGKINKRGGGGWNKKFPVRTILYR